MKNFFDWVKDRDLELPEINDVATPEGDKIEERRSRTGVRSGLVPDAYYNSQYPDLYKTPPASDAVTYLSNKKKKG